MSSSNQVRVSFITESTYGVTPAVGSFDTARFVSESLSGTPETVESKQIRVDRMSGGQIVTGLTVGGDLNFELAKESQLESFLESAMYNTWDVLAAITVDLTIDIALKKITRATGDFTTSGLKVGDFCKLAGFTTPANNADIMITAILSATEITYAGPEGMANEVGVGTSLTRADKLTIGSTKKSFSIEKKFLDLTNKGINYLGMVASMFSLNVAYGDLITGSFGFMGNGYKTADTASELITNGRTVNAAATTNTLNGSVDMPYLASSATGALDNSEFDVQSVALKLDNNLNPQTVIGNIAPKDYSAGQATITVDISAYLTNNSWAMLEKKLAQTEFALGFIVRNAGGAYAFFMPALQVSFEDPSSPGANQDIIMGMSGVAKVGATGESALNIYRLA